MIKGIGLKYSDIQAIQRLKLAREQERLYEQERTLQTALDDSKPAR